MTKTPQLCVKPENQSMVVISAHGEMGQVLPTVGIRAFAHHYEITVVDLAGDLVHEIIIKQNGNLEFGE